MTASLSVKVLNLLSPRQWRVDFQLEQLQSPRVSVGRHIARLGMIGGDDGFGYVLPGILMENDSDTDPEDSLDTGYCLQSSIKSEYDLELESRIKMEIPDSCSEFFTLVTYRSCFCEFNQPRNKKLCNSKL